MPDNKLWASHRLILPEMREKAVRRCEDCRFFVFIQGKEEARRGCVVSIPEYGTLQKRVPEIIPVPDILKKAGSDGLQTILARQDPRAPACGLYRPKIPRKEKPPPGKSLPILFSQTRYGIMQLMKMRR